MASVNETVIHIYVSFSLIIHNWSMKTNWDWFKKGKTFPWKLDKTGPVIGNAFSERDSKFCETNSQVGPWLMHNFQQEEVLEKEGKEQNRFWGNFICDAAHQKGDFAEATSVLFHYYDNVLHCFIDCFWEQMFQKTWVLYIGGWNQPNIVIVHDMC